LIPDTQNEMVTRWRVLVTAQALPLLVVLLLAFGLRVYHLDFQSLWADEGISLVRSRLPYNEMIRTLPAEHVPGYWLLLRAWVSLAGVTDFALRYLSLLPSVLAIALGYRLAADLGSRRAGLITALLLATSSFQVWYAQEARMYSWLVAAGMASTWLLWRLLSARKPVLLLIGYVLLVSAAINLQFYGFLVPLAHTVFALVWLTYTRNVRVFLRWVVAGLAVLVLYLPWWPRLVEASSFRGCCPAPDPMLLPWRFLTAYTVSDSMPPTLHDRVPWLYLLLVFFGAWAWYGRNRLGGWLLACAAFVPLAATFTIAVVTRDFYHERYAIVASVPLVMLAAEGFNALDLRFWRSGRQHKSALLRPPVSTALTALVLACLVSANLGALYRLYTDTTVQKADFRAIVRRIEASELPGDVILAHGLDPQEIFAHYYHGEIPVHNVHSLRSQSDAEVDAALSQLTEGARRVWMVHYDPPTTSVEYWLANNAWLADRSRYGLENLTLSVYGLPDLPQLELPLNVAFGSVLRLSGAVLAGGTGNGREFRAGDLLGVTTTWDVIEPPPSLIFSLRLLDSEGRAWLSTDYVPVEGSAPTQAWRSGEEFEDRRGLLLPADLPPGTYEVFLMLYDSVTGVPVGVRGREGTTLASIHVLPAAVAPDPSVLLIPKRVTKRLGDRLELLGFDITPQPLRPGQGASLTLWWRAVDSLREPYRVQVQARGQGVQSAFAGTYPLSRVPEDTWQPGQVVREHYRLGIDPAASSGKYRVDLLLAAADGRLIGAPLSLGTVAISARPRTYHLPQASHPLEVSLGDSVLLRAYDLILPEAPGEGLHVNLYWQSKQRLSISYKVFVHLIDDGGRIVAQADSIPADGLAPTESWLPGEIVADRHILIAPAPGRYRILVGLYDPASGERLPVLDKAQRLLSDSAIPLSDVELR
jgi:4-amino-4-deoxy-L-arabinose transferase-like glycosyltransferase